MLTINIVKKYKEKGKNSKSLKYYLKIYFICVFSSLVIFGIGNFFKDDFTCANTVSCKEDLAVRVDNESEGFFYGRQIVPPKVDLEKELASVQVLGDKDPDAEKRIYVDLSTQMIHAYEGNKEFMRTIISSGKWGRTPVGNFNVWIKLPVTRMAGGSGNDAYDLPNVQWVMYFYRDYGTHTAYWHNNFGTPMSHGCINMREIDAKKLYFWSDAPTSSTLGTPVSVCNQFNGVGKCTQVNPINPIEGGV